MDIKNKKLIIFDLDGTLAPSKQSLQDDMVPLFLKLLGKKKIAVISGGGYPRFEAQILNKLPTGPTQFSDLYLLPTSGTRLYSWRGSWCEQYAEHLSPQEKEKVMAGLHAAIMTCGHQTPHKLYGPVIEDRGSQITFSALGQQAPYDQKKSWDPTREKRQKIVLALSPRIPEFDVRIAGTTSIDITKKGVNKAYGIRKLEDFLHITPDEIVFVGDSLFHGGNDYPARATGVDCIAVKNPEETRQFISVWLEQIS